jgi:hypothetical protein
VINSFSPLIAIFLVAFLKITVTVAIGGAATRARIGFCSDSLN